MKNGRRNSPKNSGNNAKARQAERNDRRESRYPVGNGYEEEDLLGGAAFEVTHIKTAIVPSPDPLKGNDLEEEEDQEQEQPGEEGAAIAQGEEQEDPEELRRRLKNLDEEAEVLAAANKAKHEENERLRLQNEEQAAQLEEAKRMIAEMQKPQPEPKAEQAPAQEDVQEKVQEIKIRLQAIKSKPSTPEDALNKAQNLLRIGERLRFMKAKQTELEGYIFGNSQTGEGLTLKDANGKAFTTNNVTLIKKVKDLVLAEIGTAVEQAEAEIMELA